MPECTSSKSTLTLSNIFNTLASFAIIPLARYASAFLLLKSIPLISDVSIGINGFFFVTYGFSSSFNSPLRLKYVSLSFVTFTKSPDASTLSKYLTAFTAGLAAVGK